MPGEPLHHGGAGVKIRPALEISNRDEELGADRLEEVAQVAFLDCDLDIAVLIVPKAEGRVSRVGVVVEVVDPFVGFGLDVGMVESLQADSFARVVLGADVERQFAGLAAVGDERLRGVKIAFGQAVLLEDITPTARADREVHC